MRLKYYMNTILIFFCLPAISFSASIHKSFTTSEMKSLPLPIQIKLRFYLGEKSPELRKKVDRYMRIYGPGYNSLHHFGMGLIYLNRFMNPRSKYYQDTFFLGHAINEFNFELSRFDPSKYNRGKSKFIDTFYPAMTYKRGEAYFYKKNITKAMMDFYTVIKMKPSFFLPYSMLSQCYLLLDQPQKARKILEHGKKVRNKK